MTLSFITDEFHPKYAIDKEGLDQYLHIHPKNIQISSKKEIFDVFN